MLDLKYMGYVVTGEELENLASYRDHTNKSLRWSSIFVLPEWLKAWWETFGSDTEIMLRLIYRDDRIIGIAPLMRQGESAYFIGSTDVCDYMDFVIMPGMEKDFFNELMDDLRRNDVKRLVLAHVRPDSTVMEYLRPLAEARGYQTGIDKEEISLETDLPGDWEEYLASLTSKQRHEVRRKLRRLNEAGEVDYRFTGDAESLNDNMDMFLSMFTEYRQDKTDFMTEQMKSFFKLLADNMSRAGLLEFGILRLDGKPIACTMCFDYDGCIYLYNSGYDPEYDYLSAGLLSKVLGIKDSIRSGKKRFDFLKGAEPYKYHLGGREVALYRYRIDL
jgi:CelD/BcsL family acetyltransferase involved in cellulose biosynthesis